MGKGHRKGWKKAKLKKDQVSPEPYSPKVSKSKVPKLNKGDSFTVVALLVGVALVFINPPLSFKVLGMTLVCVGFVLFFKVSHWTHKWSRKWQDIFAALTVIILCAVSIPQFIAQWRSEHSKPDDITVSPSRIIVSSKEWERIDIVTVTNHKESPRYGITLSVGPTITDVEYTIEAGPSIIFTDNSREISIYQIGPKASYAFRLVSKLKAGSKSSHAEIKFSVTQGTDEPTKPGVMIHKK